MKQLLGGFLDAIDTTLVAVAGTTNHLDCYVIGRAALVLHHNLNMPAGGTKDLDVVQFTHPMTPLLAKAVELFGKGTANDKQYRLYLEPVIAALPPVPAWFKSRSTETSGNWRVLRLWQLEVHDLAATKLKSFRAQDRDDLQFLCDRRKLRYEALEESLRHAFLWDTPKDGDPDYDRALNNLKRVGQYLEGTIPSL